MSMKLKEKCPKCKKALEMYYVPWCPRCEKPEPRLQPVWNFLKCLYHLEATGHKGIKERVWRYSCESDSMKSNDSYMDLWFKTAEDDEDEDPQILADLATIKSVFGIEKDHATFWVSW